MRTAVLVLLFAAKLAGQPGSIEGNVVDQIGSRPIAGVHVQLYIGAMPQMAKSVYGAMTDADGHYSVAAIAPGTYTVQLERAGYLAVPANSVTYNTEIVVHRGEHIAGRKLTMLPLILLSGRVVNRYGDPVPDVTVEVSADSANPGRGIGPYNQSQADDQGAFRLFVTPGKYYVIAGSTNYGPRNDIAEIRTDGTADLYAATYYPSAADLQSASPVEAKGGEVAGIEIHMRTTSAARSNLTLSGMVTGIPAGAAATVSYSWGDTPGKFQSASRTTTGPDGRFSFEHIGAGYLSLLAQCSSAESELQSDLAEVHLEAADVSDLQLALTPGGLVTGTLEIEGTDTAALAGKLMVGLTPAQAGFNMPRFGTVEGDGTFRMTGVAPGKFTVNVGVLPDRGYVRAILLNGAATDGTVDFSQGVRGPRLKIAVGLNGAEISGELHEADGGPLLNPRPSVYLVPEPGTVRPMLPLSAIDGSHYALKGVPPGKYKLFAADYSLVTDETRPAFLAGAETLEVAEGGRVIRDLKMMEAPSANPKQ